jgi:hypothetical protein
MEIIKPGFVDYVSAVLDEDESLKAVLHVSTAGELAEKVALTTARAAFEIAVKHPGCETLLNLEILKQGVRTGDWDSVLGAAEAIHEIAEPKPQLPLVGEVFNSLIKADPKTDQAKAV